MLSGEATNINFIVFGLTRPGLKPTIYRTRVEHTNYYTTAAVALYLTNMLSLNFIVLAHWNNSSWVNMSSHSDTLSWFQNSKANQFLILLNAVCLAEKQHISILVFGLTDHGLGPRSTILKASMLTITPRMRYS